MHICYPPIPLRKSGKKIPFAKKRYFWFKNSSFGAFWTILWQKFSVTFHYEGGEGGTPQTRQTDNKIKGNRCAHDHLQAHAHYWQTCPPILKVQNMADLMGWITGKHIILQSLYAIVWLRICWSIFVLPVRGMDMSKFEFYGLTK